MSTSATGSAPYATPANFVIKCDNRTAGQLLSDVGVPLTQPQIAASPTLLDLLAEASGLVEAACTEGGAYVINPLAVPPINDLLLIQTAGGNSAALLAGIVCRLALWLMWERRPSFRQDVKLPAQAQWALDLLEQIHQGKRIFGILEHQQAGVLGITVDSPRVIEARRGPVQIARRFFGRRSQESRQWGCP